MFFVYRDETLLYDIRREQKKKKKKKKKIRAEGVEFCNPTGGEEEGEGEGERGVLVGPSEATQASALRA